MNSKLCCALYPKFPHDIAILLARVVMGAAFILHGWGKIQSPMSWMGPEAPVPGILQFLAAFAEFGGGIALVIGLLTRLASLGIAITMAVAVYTHAVVMGDGFVSTGPGVGSFELPLVYLVVALVFMATGCGRYGLDSQMSKMCTKSA